MKIGLFGGTFNPVHSGHVGVARKAVSDLALDKLVVLPAATSPFKTSALPTLTDEMRLHLVEIAFAGLEKIRVDAREREKGGVSYAMDTVREFAAENPGAEIFFIIGEDSLEGLPRWKDFGELKSLCTFKAYPRTVESSTEIRRRIHAGEDYSQLVPDRVYLALMPHVLLR